MTAAQRFGVLLLVLTFLLAPLGRAGAQSSDDEQYFAETGHTVKGEFLRFYREAADSELVYGYPVTEQFTARDGKVVQYFERARFEWHPDKSEQHRVLLGLLGKEALAGRP